MNKLQEGGIEQTAFHNHLRHESPRLIYMHIMGRGVPAKLAAAVQAALVLNGTVIPPSMGVATAINFQPTGRGRAAVTGDFVLTASEVNPVLRTLRENGIDVTALHSHVLAETPRLYSSTTSPPTVVQRGATRWWWRPASGRRCGSRSPVSAPSGSQ
jgi:hypothetical protein